MGITNELTKLLKEKNTNANELGTKAGIPPSTIYSLIRRDSNRVDVDSLVKIARYLEVSVDHLLGIETKKGNTDKRLQEIINNYNCMTEDGKNSLSEQAEFLLGKHPKAQVN